MTRETLLGTDVLSLIMRRRSDAVFHAKEYLKHHPRLSFSAITAYEVMRSLKTQGAAAKVADFHVFCRAAGCCHALSRSLKLPQIYTPILSSAANCLTTRTSL